MGFKIEGKSATPIIIAIDGANASGKGTIARMIAAHFGFEHLDTGLLYRAIAYRLKNQALDYHNIQEILAIAKDPLSLVELGNTELRGEEFGQIASKIAIYPELRRILDTYQRDFPKGKKGVVVDGRDIGSFIFPDADVKLFFTAALEERAKRRFKELQSQGKDIIYDQVLTDIVSREKRDAGRSVNPSVPAADAIMIDTSALTPEMAFAESVRVINQKIKNKL